ncbi:hypothetical protein PV08_08872 [Exophiala spinifera]|uniref:SET domain-containing protein n=1 Tax=Exophiala spinifera TaxID=91928 RepID=A0A0D1YF30_9EURO|nr:uncharacterized protein PV08_08872 [Exophiala spinifera]KIW13681.1 hypothetical protein PV08_08872 [Exophiala spinifera]
MTPELVLSILPLFYLLSSSFAQEQNESITTSATTESFHPWSYAPICTEHFEALGGPLCVYTNATFANGRGISIFTTPSISESFAAQLPFHDDNVLAEHGINDPRGEEARPWYVTDLPGKGKGVLAKHELHRGDRIKAYTPYILVYMEGELTVDEREKWVKIGISQLPEASREHFFSLATIWNEEGYEVQDVIKANGFEMQVGGVMHIAVFPETSRLNHACGPNAQYFLEPGLLTHFVHASRDIAPDEEITVSYAPPLRFHETRQRYLKDHFHFTCDCSRCQSGEASDHALHQIDALQSSLGNWTPESTASVKKAEELIRLYKQQGLEGFLDTAYGYAALTYNAVGSVRGAKKYAKLAAQSAALKFGPSHKDVAVWKELEKNPQGHVSWMRRKANRL